MSSIKIHFPAITGEWELFMIGEILDDFENIIEIGDIEFGQLHAYNLNKDSIKIRNG